MKSFRTVVAVVLLCSVHQATAMVAQLIDFSQLVQAVENGFNVRAIIHFDRCLITNSDPQTQVTRLLQGASTRVNFTQYLHFRDSADSRALDTVSTSTRIFIERPHEKIKSLFARLRVFEDNTALFQVHFDNPGTGEPLTVDWLCNINNGNNRRGDNAIDVPQLTINGMQQISGANVPRNGLQQVSGANVPRNGLQQVSGANVPRNGLQQASGANVPRNGINMPHDNEINSQRDNGLVLYNFY